MEPLFYEDLLDRISDGVYFVDRDRRITYWNCGAERITGYHAAEVLGHSCAEGILRHVSSRGHQLCLHGCPLSAVMGDGHPRNAEVFLHHKDGHRVAVTVHGSPIADASGVITGSVEVFSPRTTSAYAGIDRRSANDALDPVTGLPPRRLGQLHLDTLANAVRDGSGTLGVLFLDADHFKNVNDTHGHRAGDQVLRMVGQSLANALRRGDVPVRWGGEEFLALLPGTDRAGLESAAERVRMLVENSWIQHGDEQIRVTVSIGATMARGQDTSEEVVDRADSLMYTSKVTGRNRVTGDHGPLAQHGEAPLTGRHCPWQATSAAPGPN